MIHFMRIHILKEIPNWLVLFDVPVIHIKDIGKKGK